MNTDLLVVYFDMFGIYTTENGETLYAKFREEKLEGCPDLVPYGLGTEFYQKLFAERLIFTEAQNPYGDLDQVFVDAWRTPLGFISVLRSELGLSVDIDRPIYEYMARSNGKSALSNIIDAIEENTTLPYCIDFLKEDDTIVRGDDESTIVSKDESIEPYPTRFVLPFNFDRDWENDGSGPYSGGILNKQYELYDVEGSDDLVEREEPDYEFIKNVLDDVIVWESLRFQSSLNIDVFSEEGQKILDKFHFKKVGKIHKFGLDIIQYSSSYFNFSLYFRYVSKFNFGAQSSVFESKEVTHDLHDFLFRKLYSVMYE